MASISSSLIESYVPSSLKIIVRLLVHSKDLCPRPPHVKHLKELVLMGSFGGAEDEGFLDLQVLAGERVEEGVACLELDLSPVLGDALVEVGGAEVAGV